MMGMAQDRTKQARELARKIVRKYFCESDMDFLISTFAEDIVWIGGGEHQQAQGREAVAASFLEGKDAMIPFHMWEERYDCVRVSEGAYLCSCDSMMEADPKSGNHMRSKQRCTFVFREKEDGSLETVHIHNSLPMDKIESDELFPNKSARESYERLQSLAVRQDRQLELTLNQLSGGMLICSTTPPFEVEWMSENLCEMLGYTNCLDFAAHTGGCCRDFILEEDYENMVRQVAEQLGGAEKYTSEYRVRTKKGDVIWVSDMGKKLVEAGNREVLYAVLADITKRKSQELQLERANREIHQTLDFLSQLYQTLPCGILQFTSDESHRTLNVNRMAWEIYGYTEEEYRSRVTSPLLLVCPEDRPDIEAHLREMTLETGPVNYTRRARRKDGSFCWISVVMERVINAQGMDVIQAIYSDVTEIKEMQIQQEQERLLENRSLRAAICTAYQCILSMNLNQDTYHCFVENGVTTSFPEQGGYQKMYLKMRELVHPAQREEFCSLFSREAVRGAFLEKREVVSSEIRMMGKDEIYHWISLQVIHVENPYGSDILGIMLLRILDEERAQKALQEQLLRDALAQAQKANRAKSEFLSRMSHDIRTPMNAVIGMTAIGKLHTEDPERVADCFEKIDASSRYLLSLLSDVLDMSKIESGKLSISREPFSFTEFLDSLQILIGPQAEKKQLEFVMRHQKDPAKVFLGDQVRLQQIVMNLLSNAVKFTPGHGLVELITDEVRQEGKTVWVQFQVRDNGIGMSPEFLQKLYLPFEQESTERARNEGGTGLGLTIVSSLVAMMGGTIRVESEKGRGTCFWVEIPLEQDLSRAQSSEEKKAQDGSLEGMRVLLAEDNDLNREIAKSMLELKGILVETAEDGQEAVNRFRESPCWWYETILMDIRMPRMDGLEATQAIRSMERPDAAAIPIMALTANAFDSDREEALRAGMTDYLIKPLDTELIYRRLQEARAGLA